MAGISQVWLTEKELEAAVEAFDLAMRYVGDLTPTQRAAYEKVRRALEPVACKV